MPLILPALVPPMSPCCPLQTKDTLTLRASSFGSKCELPDTFLKKVFGAGVPVGAGPAVGRQRQLPGSFWCHPLLLPASG